MKFNLGEIRTIGPSNHLSTNRKRQTSLISLWDNKKRRNQAEHTDYVSPNKDRNKINTRNKNETEHLELNGISQQPTNAMTSDSQQWNPINQNRKYSSFPFKPGSEYLNSTKKLISMASNGSSTKSTKKRRRRNDTHRDDGIIVTKKYEKFKERSTKKSPLTENSTVRSDTDTENQLLQDNDNNKEKTEETCIQDVLEVKKSFSDDLSPYELLRLERIKRNEARLAALGLSSNLKTKEKLVSIQKKGNHRKKAKASVNTANISVPIRRSTRLRKDSVAPNQIQESQGSDNNKKMTKSMTIEKGDQICGHQEEEDVHFTISPIMGYVMGLKQNIAKYDSPPEKKIDSYNSPPKSFQEAGPKLIPPVGLSAIYSLQFLSVSDKKYDMGTSEVNNTKLVVGAGKGGIVCLWNWQKFNSSTSAKESEESNAIEPILAWKGHKNRWISSAKFLSPSPSLSSTQTFSAENSNSPLNHLHDEILPPRLLTAGNDGSVSLWDLSSVSTSTGSPQIIATNKSIHSSGIFSMDVVTRNMHCSMAEKNLIFDENILVCTGSKDKTVAVSTLEGIVSKRESLSLWRSDFHGGKVGAVAMRGDGSSLLLSASDDGIIALHDYKVNGLGNLHPAVSKLDDAHVKPHSVEWNPVLENEFMTAGHDSIVKTWDIRNLSNPLCMFRGHVPTNISRRKQIHHPVYYIPFTRNRKNMSIITGGEKSSSLSLFLNNTALGPEPDASKAGSAPYEEIVYNRNLLPNGSGDAGSIATDGDVVAVSVYGGEVLMLCPRA